MRRKDCVSITNYLKPWAIKLNKKTEIVSNTKEGIMYQMCIYISRCAQRTKQKNGGNKYQFR